MSVNVLHFANDYAGSKVYKNLFESLDILDIQQTVYVAIRSQHLSNKNFIDFNAVESKILYRNIINNSFDKVFYHVKINKILRDVKKTVNFNNINIIHAHTWFSDGAVAFELNREFNIPYIIAIRNTDLNIFYKYLIYLRNYGFNILEHAEKIIFISQAYFERFKSIIGKENLHLLKKCVIIPNGVDKYWLQEVDRKKHNGYNKCKKLLYVGRFTKGKNLKNLILAVNYLSKNGLNISLSLVGSGGDSFNEILKLIDSFDDRIQYLGQVDNKEQLREIYLNHDYFTMPSRNETFGLVYVEALLHGLPVLYTANEGIDGLYKNIGEKIKKGDVVDIKNKLLKLIKNVDYNIDYELLRQNHDWEVISLKYKNIYENIIPTPIF